MVGLLRWLLGLLFLLLLVVVGTVGYFTATDSGLQRLLSLGRQYAPGQLAWESAEGRILGPLDLVGLSYRQENGLSVEVGQAALRWEPGALLSRQLRLQRLALSRVELHLPPPAENPSEKDTGPLQLPDISLPLGIHVDELDLEDIRIFPWGVEKPIIIESVRLVAAAEGDALQLVELKVQAPEGAARLSGTVQPQGSYPLDLNLAWNYQHPQFGTFTGSGTASGDLEKLQVEQKVEGAMQVQLSASVTDLISKPGWDATLKLGATDLGVLSPALKASPLQALLVSRGHLEQFTLSGTLDTTLQQTGPVSLNLQASGNPRKLHLEEVLLQLVDQPARIKLTGDVDLQPLKLDLQGDWKSLGWPLRGANPDYRLPQGTISFSGTPKDFVAKLNTNLDGRDIGPLQASLDLQGRGKKITLSALDVQAPDGQLRLHAGGSFDLQAQTIDARGQWSSLAWPLTAEPMVTSPKGSFMVSGLLTDYRFQLQADAAGQDIPAGSWQLEGRGSDTSLQTFSLLGKLLEGELRVAGAAAWKPAVSWSVTVDGKGLNPGVQWPQLPGNLNLQMSSKGGVIDGKPDLVASITALNGRFRGQPVKGAGRMALQNGVLDIDAFRVSSGRTSIRANGRLGEQWDLKWRLDAPQLATLLPDLKGTIKGRGTLQGTATAPVVALDLDIRNLVAGATRVERLAGKAVVDIRGSSRSTIDFTGRQMTLAGQKWSKLTLSGKGLPEKHALQLRLDGELANLKLALSGGLEGKAWSGRLMELAALKTRLGDWQLEQPVRLQASAEAASATGLCLSSKPAKICMDGQWDKTAGAKGDVTIASLDAARFKAFLPTGMQLQTALDGKLNGTFSASGQLTGGADIQLARGRLTVAGDAEPVQIDFGETRVQSRLDGKKVDSSVDIDLGELGGINGAVRLTGMDANAALAGTIKARLADLAMISAFVPQLQSVQGRLSADLKLGGTVTMPKVNGELLLDAFAAEVPQMSIRIEDVRLKARSDGNGPLQITGKARSGEGQLALSGEVDPASRALQLQLKGKRFQVANTRNIRAVISPDMKIGMDDKGMRVEGELRIPSAHIKAGGGGGEGGVVSVSSDVVIVDENGAAPKKAKTGNFYLDLRIVLGDDIKVEAADFRGVLKGNLVVKQQPGLTPRGTGVIEVVNGDYIVYGQQLNMQRGRILFGGGPIDNPRLDMDVARRVEAYDVLAGARIRGTVQAPLLQLYSEPSMPDASILSYMLLGQPPGTKGGSYTLGKYLTPDLYVGYGIGLFNAINTFNMRYKLTEKLALQAASGIASSADLVYTFER
jgi:translocation and assembly module TamB